MSTAPGRTAGEARATGDGLLLVDDEADIRRIGALSLRAVGGFDVRVASSGAEALVALESFAPRVILLDVMMPELSGLEVYGRIRAMERRADVPVIFLTASVQRHEIERYLALGAAGVIAKPFDPMQLPSEVRRILGDAR